MPDEPEKLTPEQAREIATTAIAKYCCVFTGIEAVDSLDGSPNWWLFMKDAEQFYDGIVKRFPRLSVTDALPNDKKDA